MWIKQIETNIQHLEINCLTWFLLFGWLCFSWSLTSLWSLFSICCSSICLAWCWCALWGRCLLSVATNNYILLSMPTQFKCKFTECAASGIPLRLGATLDKQCMNCFDIPWNCIEHGICMHSSPKSNPTTILTQLNAIMLYQASNFVCKQRFSTKMGQLFDSVRLTPWGALSKNTHPDQQNNHVLGVNLELSALQSDI